jgi:hypothetical protein
LEDRGVDGKMGLEWILGRLAGVVWSGFKWLRIGTLTGSCECVDEPSGSGAVELVSLNYITYLFTVILWKL